MILILTMSVYNFPHSLFWVLFGGGSPVIMELLNSLDMTINKHNYSIAQEVLVYFTFPLLRCLPMLLQVKA